MPPSAAIIDADSYRLSAEEKTFFRDADPWGFILFARNIDTPEQVRALCAEMREAVGREAVITIDQEGGRVQRLSGPRWRQWLPPLETVLRAGENAERALYCMYRVIADELHALGIDSNCAPVLDVAGPQTHDFLRNRCYAQSPGRVATLGRAVANGLRDGGVLPVMKHMPGHGRPDLDTHFDLPHISASLDDLEADFAPFRDLGDLPMGMTGHLVLDAVDSLPATLSPKVVALIRERIGFDNLLMTDDISMKALKGPPDETAAMAVAAGVDVVLFCNAPLDQRRAVVAAAGPMGENARARAGRALAARQVPDDVDIPALEREFEALLGGTVHG